MGSILCMLQSFFLISWFFYSISSLQVKTCLKCQCVFKNIFIYIASDINNMQQHPFSIVLAEDANKDWVTRTDSFVNFLHYLLERVKY